MRLMDMLRFHLRMYVFQLRISFWGRVVALRLHRYTIITYGYLFSLYQQHAYRDGHLEEMVLCHLGAEDGQTVIAKDIRLSDFLNHMQIRLDLGDNTKRSRRIRKGSQNSSAGTLSARYRNPSERPKVRDRLKDNDGNMFGRLGHRRQSAFDLLSDTYSPSITKSGLDRASFRDHSHSRGRPHRRDSSLSRDRPRSRDRSYGIEESYGNTCSSYRIGARHGYHSRNRDRPRIMKRGRESESLLSRVSESDTSDGGY
ncbi:hypothetical protein Tco_0976026 [Tanacetum coccineum]|uniref:Uncharacterized protein n=1 Tax=Tanacetum coccineum TaxID=301880 RepID=A0ABQ5EG28_9ASTR